MPTITGRYALGTAQYHCPVCNVYFASSTAAIRAHENGKKHLEKVREARDAKRERRKEEEKEAERRRKEEEERRLLEEMGYPGFEKTKGDYDDLSFISPGPVWASVEDISRNEDFYSFWMSDSGATFTPKLPGGSRSGGSDAKKRKRVEKKEGADDDAEEM
mmetsp:Transcript_31645/g.62747  ORF Transcript_31645/g.62747 Transcript_31645/m.62747 type:complete len:161 (+) Transcript_31645:232-714(+)